MRQFLVRTLDKEFRINADKMYMADNDNYVYFDKVGVGVIAAFCDLEYAYELAEGKDAVIYGIMMIEDRYAVTIGSGTPNLKVKEAEEN